MISTRQNKLSEKVSIKENVSEGDDDNSLKISIRNKSLAKNDEDIDDDELDIEILSKEEIKQDRNKENLIVVDLREAISPINESGSKEKPVLSISLDQKETKNNSSRTQRRSSKRKNKNFDTDEDLPKSNTRDDRTLTDIVNESAHFADDNTSFEIRPSVLYKEENTENQISQNMITKLYKSPEQNHYTKMSNLTPNDSANIVMIESIVEDKLKKTNNLINEAIDALKYERVPAISDANISKIPYVDSDRHYFNETSNISNVMTNNENIDRHISKEFKLDEQNMIEK